MTNRAHVISSATVLSSLGQAEDLPSERASERTQGVVAGQLRGTEFHGPGVLDILTCCARVSCGIGDAGTLDDVSQQDIAWELLLDAARYHGLLLVMLDFLESRPISTPHAVLERIRNFSKCRQDKDTRLQQQLAELSAWFEESAVPAVAMRGPALASLAYPKPSVRQTGDLDFLVRGPDVAKLAVQLERLGFEKMRQVGRPHADSVFTLFHRNSGTQVDLHTRLEEKYFPIHLSFESIWKRRQTVIVDGCPVPTFGTIDLLIATCAHGARRQWSKLKWICDVAQLIQSQHDSVDWQELTDRARQAGAARMLALGFQLSEEVLGVRAPREAIDVQHAGQPVGNLTRQVREWWGRDVWQTLPTNEEFAFMLRSRERFHDRLALLRHKKSYAAQFADAADFTAVDRSASSKQRVRISYLLGY